MQDYVSVVFYSVGVHNRWLHVMWSVLSKFVLFVKYMHVCMCSACSSVVLCFVDMRMRACTAFTDQVIHKITCQKHAHAHEFITYVYQV